MKLNAFLLTTLSKLSEFEFLLLNSREVVNANCDYFLYALSTRNKLKHMMSCRGMIVSDGEDAMHLG